MSTPDGPSAGQPAPTREATIPPVSDAPPVADTQPAALPMPPGGMPSSPPELAQLAELRELAGTLMATAQAAQAKAAYNAAIQDALDQVKTAAAMLRAPVPTRKAPAQESGRPCGGPCDCVDVGCCTFDIYMSSMRVLAMQNLEIEDSVANPWGELEVRVFAYLDSGIGAVIPSMFSTISLRKLVNHVGLPVQVNRLIGTVAVPKGAAVAHRITTDFIEDDAGLAERATGGRDEEGTASGFIMLDCCTNTSPTTSFDMTFTSGGQGGGSIGVTFTAVKRCC